KFDGVNWTVYNTSNSGLPNDWVHAIAIDGQGNKWIGTSGGLAVYREGGVILDVYEKDEEITPREFALYQNYPNPFNPSTFIIFDLPREAKVKLGVYDVMGRLVKVLIDEQMQAGRYRVELRGDGLASGVYFYRLEAGGFVSVKKMVLVK
ncbi:T9SS type A sorting domain-containing protein, partial [Candidatus Kryptobacter tengchongensis]